MSTSEANVIVVTLLRVGAAATSRQRVDVVAREVEDRRAGEQPLELLVRVDVVDPRAAVRADDVVAARRPCPPPRASRRTAHIRATACAISRESRLSSIRHSTRNFMSHAPSSPGESQLVSAQLPRGAVVAADPAARRSAVRRPSPSAARATSPATGSGTKPRRRRRSAPAPRPARPSRALRRPRSAAGDEHDDVLAVDADAPAPSGCGSCRARAGRARGARRAAASTDTRRRRGSRASARPPAAGRACRCPQ